MINLKWAERSAKYSWYALLVTMVFVACTTPPPRPELEERPVVVEYVQVAYDCGTPPGVTQIKITDVEWKLYQIGGETVFSLTTENYTLLAEGVANVLLASRQLRAQRDFYVACIERSQNP